MSEKSIPDLVLATLRMHTAKAEMDLVRVNDELDRTTAVTARSRVLRHLRDQLTAQRDAWEYLVVVAGSEHYRAYQEIKNGPPNEIDEKEAAEEQAERDFLKSQEAHDAGWDQPFHRARGCNGAWETGTDGATRKCADCKGPMDDLGGTQ
jgi:hypothetical protein